MPKRQTDNGRRFVQEVVRGRTKERWRRSFTDSRHLLLIKTTIVQSCPGFVAKQFGGHDLLKNKNLFYSSSSSQKLLRRLAASLPLFVPLPKATPTSEPAIICSVATSMISVVGLIYCFFIIVIVLERNVYLKENYLIMTLRPFTMYRPREGWAIR